jgi:3D (Asp-Asp-Asp) domain-containing protein
MKSYTFLGSALGVLLIFSVFSYPRTFTQAQDPKPVQQPTQPTQVVNPQSNSVSVAAEESADAAKSPSDKGPAVAEASENKAPVVVEKPVETFVVPAQIYTATAYSLCGRTASGRPVAKGLIAADPRVLPMGSRVRVEAGEFTGEYVVADTGGSVKGRRIDIWTATLREAKRFGRRTVKLTVLEFGGKRGKVTNARPQPASPVAKPVAEPVAKSN